MNYWHVITKDGDIRDECEGRKWEDVKDNIEELSLDIPNNHQRITLPKGFEYIQAKTASADFTGGNATIESRYIAFKLGNNIVRVRVDEKSNDISIEVD